MICVYGSCSSSATSAKLVNAREGLNTIKPLIALPASTLLNVIYALRVNSTLLNVIYALRVNSKYLRLFSQFTGRVDDFSIVQVHFVYC